MAGAIVEPGLPGLRPHDLRHTAASLAIASGASVKHVQRMLGHKDSAMTLNVYASLFEDDLDDLVRAARLRPFVGCPCGLGVAEAGQEKYADGRPLRGGFNC